MSNDAIPVTRRSSTPAVGTPRLETGGKPGLLRQEPGLEALEACYRESYSSLYLQALRMLGTPEAAADVAHEAFAEIASTIKRGTKIENPGGWLRVVVRNLALIQLRRKTLLPLLNEAGAGNPDPSAEIAYVKQHCSEVLEAIDRLPKAQRSAILLAAARGLNTSEIATVLGRTENAVRQLLNRARNSLRDTFGPDALPQALPLLQQLGVRNQIPHRGTGNASSNALADYLYAKLAKLQNWVATAIGRCEESIMYCGYHVAAIAAAVAVVGVGAADTPLASTPSVEYTAAARIGNTDVPFAEAKANTRTTSRTDVAGELTSRAAVHVGGNARRLQQRDSQKTDDSGEAYRTVSAAETSSVEKGSGSALQPERGPAPRRPEEDSGTTPPKSGPLPECNSPAEGTQCAQADPDLLLVPVDDRGDGADHGAMTGPDEVDSVPVDMAPLPLPRQEEDRERETP